MVIQLFLFAVGFFLLIKGANWLVNGSVSLAKRYNVSELTIGLTIVAFGTSAPELVVNILSSIRGYNDVTLGNIIGSNLFNLLFILGVTGVIFPISVQIKTVRNEIPFSLIAAISIISFAYLNLSSKESYSISRNEGVILLLFFLGFMIYIFRNMKSNQIPVETDGKIYKPLVAFMLIIIGLIALVAGSKLVVDNTIKIAQTLGISEKLIALTVVSAGTSLPELTTSLVAAWRKKSDIAIGNVIGSNIFNVFLILGLSATISPISYNKSFNIDILLLIAATIGLLVFMFSGKRYRLDRWEASIFVLTYVIYLVYLILSD